LTKAKQGIFSRAGPDIRQCRIIRPDIRHIRPDLAGTGYPASGKKYRSGPTLIFSLWNLEGNE